MAWAHNQERYMSNRILSVVDKIEWQFEVNVNSTFNSIDVYYFSANLQADLRGQLL
jgi:hypothetical protein